MTRTFNVPPSKAAFCCMVQSDCDCGLFASLLRTGLEAAAVEGEEARAGPVPDEDVEARCLDRTGVFGAVAAVAEAGEELGSGGGGGCVLLVLSFVARMVPRCFALRTRVARSGLEAVPGERYSERRFVR